MANLTSTGAVNLTASTNWSPAQVPANGDTITLAGHTLTLDASKTFDTLTITNASARFAYSSSVTIGATNGFLINHTGALTTLLTDLTAGQTLVFEGCWKRISTGGITVLFTVSGGDLTLTTIGDDPTAILWDNNNLTGNITAVVSSTNGTTLNTTGLIKGDSSNTFAFATIVNASANTAHWTHNSTGDNTTGSGLQRYLTATGAGRIDVDWTGDIDSYTTLNTGLFVWSTTNSNSVFNLTGDGVLRAYTASAGVNYTSFYTTGNGTGTLNVSGKWIGKGGRNVAFTLQPGSAGRFNYRDQTVNIASDESMVIYANGLGTADLTGLVINNAGRFAYMEYAGMSTVVDTDTLITNTTANAQALVYTASGELEGKVITLASDAPTLPEVDEVQAGIEYGYDIAPLTGTGLIISPSVLAEALNSEELQEKMDIVLSSVQS